MKKDLKVKTCLSSYMLSDKNRTVEVFQMDEKNFIIKVDGKHWEHYKGTFKEALNEAKYMFKYEENQAFLAMNKSILEWDK